MDVDGQVAGPDLGGVRVLDRGLPALRIGQEELDRVGAGRLGRGERVGGVDVGADRSHAARLVRAADVSGRRDPHWIGR